MPPVSIEEFAAYLDGNLTEEGMDHVSSIITCNKNLSDIVVMNDVVDDTKEHYMQDEELLPAEIKYMDFDFPRISDELAAEEHLFLNDDLILDEHEENDYQQINEGTNSNLYNKNNTNQNDIEFMAKTFDKDNEMQASIAAHKIFGEDGFGPDGGLDPVIYQGNEGVCAIRSQQIILRDYGIDVSLDELKQYAITNGWYDSSPEGGTPMWAIGNLLLSLSSISSIDGIMPSTFVG